MTQQHLIVECLNSQCPLQTFSELLQNLNYSLPQLWPKSSAAVKIPENYLIMLTFPEFCAPTLLQTNVYNVGGYWPPTAQQDLPTRPLLLLFLPIFSQHTFTPLYTIVHSMHECQYLYLYLYLYFHLYLSLSCQ